MVGLERTSYYVSEGAVVIVCATVRSPSISCPIIFPFNVRLSTVDMTAGELVLCIIVMTAAHYIHINF